MKRAVIYTRQSLDKTGDGLAVARQQQDCEQLCRERGWAVAEVVTDNDVSASNGKARPGYHRVLNMVDARSVDVVVCWAVDRLVRKLTDLEDVIVRCERAGVRLATVSGDIDLSTDAGRLVGRILASVARSEVERKGARQKRASRQRAELGQPVKWCPRPFGYATDKITPVPAEEAAIAEGCEQLLAGGSLRSIAAQWQEAGLTPPQRPGSTWKGQTVRAVLMNPRIAGLSAYRGEVVGKGTWPPLVSEETWRAACALLTDKARYSGGSGARTGSTLLGGLAKCRTCGAHVYGGNNSRGRPIYRCTNLPGGGGGHVARLRELVDDYVAEVVIERLSRKDAAELLIDRNRPDVDALRTEGNTLRARLEDAATDYADGAITSAQLRVITERITANLAAVEAQMAEAGRLNVLGPLVHAEDVRAAWEALDRDRRRAVIDNLFEVSVHSPGRGARGFDPSSVEITWRQE